MTFRQLISLFIILILGGCGGGTTGSSSTSIVSEKSFRGKIVNTTGAPLSGATVTVAATGESDVTDSDGAYLIVTSVSNDQQEIIIRSADGSFFTITTVFPGPDGNFESTLTLSTTMRLAYRGFTIEARVSGENCAGAFAAIFSDDPAFNELQASRSGAFGSGFDEILDVPVGANCSITGRVLKNGAPFQNAGWELFTGGCDSASSTSDDRTADEQLDDRTKLAVGDTGAGGEFSAPFRFDPRPGSCNWTLAFRDGLPATGFVSVFSRFERDNF